MLLDVFGNNGLVAVEEFRDLVQAEPGRILDQADVNTGLPVVSAVENDFPGALAHFAAPPRTSSRSPSASFSMARMSALISSSVRSGCGL